MEREMDKGKVKTARGFAKAKEEEEDEDAVWFGMTVFKSSPTGSAQIKSARMGGECMGERREWSALRGSARHDLRWMTNGDRR